MTCFSIQKYLHIFLIAAVFFASPCLAQMKTESDNEEGYRQITPQSPNSIQVEKTDAPIVIELFTTADCSACVFADRLLYDSMKEGNVIGLSCYIKDMKAHQDGAKEEVTQSRSDKPMDPCTFRQWTYLTGKSMQDVTVRAPSFMVNGTDRVDTIDEKYFTSIVEKFQMASNNKILEAVLQWKDNDTLTIHLPQDPGHYKPNASVWLIRYKDMAIEKIDTGVNRGRVLRFSNIIQDIKHIAKWRGDMRTIDVDVTKPEGGKERGGYVILASELMGSTILVAGKIEDYPTPTDNKKPEEAPSTEGKTP